MKWIEDSVEDVKKISDKINLVTPIEEKKEEVISTEPQTAFSKMKAFVRKAVDCCIE